MDLEAKFPTFRLGIFICGANLEVPVSVRPSACLPVPDFEFWDKIVITKPLPRQICCCDLICLSNSSCPGLESAIHFIRYCYLMEDDWTGTPLKMPACLSVNEFYTPQILRPESSFFLLWSFSRLKFWGTSDRLILDPRNIKHFLQVCVLFLEWLILIYFWTTTYDLSTEIL